MTELDRLSIASFVHERNREKILFTAGPASLVSQNLTGLRPCFGRGDPDYAQVEEEVLGALKRMTGHEHIVRLQGSASLALEIATLNFLEGVTVVVNTGYYSDRLKAMAESAQRRERGLNGVSSVDWRDLDEVSGKADWLLACSVETSRALRLPIEDLAAAAKRLGAKLLLDATASIGLEEGHEHADVIVFSSCKGLCGLTGAAFIAFNKLPRNPVDSFYLSLSTHMEKKVTGPYHAICSLLHVTRDHTPFRQAVEANKRRCLEGMAEWVVYPQEHQPNLCTYVSRKVHSRDGRVVLYEPRTNLEGSVICHLGEVHLGSNARGEILRQLSTDG